MYNVQTMSDNVWSHSMYQPVHCLDIVQDLGSACSLFGDCAGLLSGHNPEMYRVRKLTPYLKPVLDGKELFLTFFIFR